MLATSELPKETEVVGAPVWLDAELVDSVLEVVDSSLPEEDELSEGTDGLVITTELEELDTREALDEVTDVITDPEEVGSTEEAEELDEASVLDVLIELGTVGLPDPLDEEVTDSVAVPETGGIGVPEGTTDELDLVDTPVTTLDEEPTLVPTAELEETGSAELTGELDSNDVLEGCGRVDDDGTPDPAGALEEGNDPEELVKVAMTVEDGFGITGALDDFPGATDEVDRTGVLEGVMEMAELLGITGLLGVRVLDRAGELEESRELDLTTELEGVGELDTTAELAVELGMIGVLDADADGLLDRAGLLDATGELETAGLLDAAGVLEEAT